MREIAPWFPIWLLLACAFIGAISVAILLTVTIAIVALAVLEIIADRRAAGTRSRRREINKLERLYAAPPWHKEASR